MDAQQFLAEFGHIANAPRGIIRLRELVLQLAISGRLVERGISETPISESLAIASKQRHKYEEDLEIRATRPGLPVSPSPYAIPDHWKWVRLEQLVLYVQRGKGPKYADRGSVWVVSQKCIQWAGFDLKQARFIADESITTYGKERFLCTGDLLWNSTGTGTAGRVAIYRAASREPCVADSHVTVIRPTEAAVSRYLWCVIASLWVQSRIQPTHPDPLVSGTTQQVELATSTIRALPIPCPPVEEQSCIVAKVDELMALCNKLEGQQQDRRKLQNALRWSTLQAVVTAISPHELKASWGRLETNFGRLFTKAKDVVSLESLLLSLAMRGLLVEQIPTDTPADLFLKEIDEQRRELVKAKKLKGGAALPPLRSEDQPYQLPKGWSWARVIDLVEVGTGATPAKSEPSYYGGNVPWYTSAATNKKFAREPDTFITEKALNETNCKVFPAGSLIVALYGQGKTRGQISELTVAGATNQALAAMVFFEASRKAKRYIKYYFEKIYEEIRLQAEGGPQPNLNVGKIKETLIPVPPIEEQARIVSRLDELFSQCDQFSSHLKKKSIIAQQLTRAMVVNLTGIVVEQEEEKSVKAPQTELIANLHLGIPPSVKAQAPLATLLARHNGEMSARDLWQRLGGEIDAFYAQLKIEVAHGWIQEPAVAEVREKLTQSTNT